MGNVSASALIAGAGIRPTGKFDPATFLQFAGLLCTNADGSLNGPIRATFTRGRPGLGDQQTNYYLPSAEDAQRAWAQVSGVEPEDAHILLNRTRAGLSGSVRAGDAIDARGHVVRLNAGPGSFMQWSHPYDREATTSDDRAAREMIRCITANAEPIVLVDGVSGGVWFIFLFDRPLRMDEAGRRTYRRQHERLCGALGGIEADDPLALSLPMPGAVGFRFDLDGREITGRIACVSRSAIEGNPAPRFGGSLDEFEAVIDRIAATPRPTA